MFSRFTLVFLTAIVVFGPVTRASASECIALWVERNQFFDQAGFCFSSALGQGYFDNSDCSTSSPSISRSAGERVAAIRSRERSLNCSAQRSSWTVSTIRNWANSSRYGRTVAPSGELSSEQLQSALTVLGAIDPSVDQSMNTEMTAAITLWQQRNGLPTTGELTGEQNALLLQQLRSGLAVSSETVVPIAQSLSVGESGSPNGIAQAPASSGQIYSPGMPIPLEGRTILPLGEHFFDEAGLIVLAALQQMPHHARLRPLRYAVSNGALEGLVPYGPQSLSDDGQLAHMSAEIDRLSFPQLERVSIALPTYIQSLKQQITQTPGPFIEPVVRRGGILGGENLAAFGSLQVLRESSVMLHFDLPRLPDLRQISMPPELAIRIRENPTAFADHGVTYVHIDVERFGPIEGTSDIGLRGNVVGVDFYEYIGRERTERYMLSFPLAQDVSTIDNQWSTYQPLISLLLDDHRFASHTHVEPLYVGDELYLETANYGIDVLGVSMLSAATKLYPSILEDDQLALNTAHNLLTTPELQRLLRGTSASSGAATRREGDRLYETLDPFERREIASRLRDEFSGILTSRALNVPTRAVQVTEVRLGEYDFSTQSFPLNISLGNGVLAYADINGLSGKVNYRYESSFVPPSALPMPESQARTFLNSFENRQNPVVYVGLHMELPAIEELASLAEFEPNTSAPTDADTELTTKVNRIVLYADDLLTRPLFEFADANFNIAMEEVGGLTAPQVAALTRPTVEEMLGTALLQDTPGNADLRRALVERTPSYSVVQASRQAEYAETILAQYTELGDPDGVWVDAAVYISEPNVDARSFQMHILPSYHSLRHAEDLESARVGVSDFVASEHFVAASQPLNVDDELLQRTSYLGYGNFPSDGGLAAIFENADGQQIAGAPFMDFGLGIHARVRIQPRVADISGDIGSTSSINVVFSPEVLEFYLLVGNADIPGDLRIIAHENFETGARSQAAEPKAPIVPLSAETIVVVRKAGFEQTSTSGLVMSCVQRRQLPDVFEGMRGIELPTSSQETAIMFLELVDDSGAWVTTSECLRDGIDGLLEAGIGVEALVVSLHGRSDYWSATELTR